jgi:hypothetical protein
MLQFVDCVATPSHPHVETVTTAPVRNVLAQS